MNKNEPTNSIRQEIRPVKPKTQEIIESIFKQTCKKLRQKEESFSSLLLKPFYTCKLILFALVLSPSLLNINPSYAGGTKDSEASWEEEVRSKVIKPYTSHTQQFELKAEFAVGPETKAITLGDYQVITYVNRFACVDDTGKRYDYFYINQAARFSPREIAFRPDGGWGHTHPLYAAGYTIASRPIFSKRPDGPVDSSIISLIASSPQSTQRDLTVQTNVGFNFTPTVPVPSLTSSMGFNFQYGETRTNTFHDVDIFNRSGYSHNQTKWYFQINNIVSDLRKTSPVSVSSFESNTEWVWRVDNKKAMEDGFYDSSSSFFEFDTLLKIEFQYFSLGAAKSVFLYLPDREKEAPLFGMTNKKEPDIRCYPPDDRSRKEAFRIKVLVPIEKDLLQGTVKVHQK